VFPARFEAQHDPSGTGRYHNAFGVKGSPYYWSQQKQNFNPQKLNYNPKVRMIFSRVLI
jgi:hypothetical protein